MLKSFTAIFLLIAVVSTNFTRFFVYAGFELNQSYIALVLCENKDKPELNCNGKCFLSKKIKEVEKNERKEEGNNLRKMFQESFIAKSNTLLINPFAFVRKITVREIPSALPNGNTDIFHPPPSFFS